MLLLFNKSNEDLNAIAIERLKNSPINFTGPGGIAKLLLTIINENIAGFYNALQVNHAQAFLSTAKGEYLKAIGYMLNCPIKTGESDEDYRYRISTQVLSSAAANETAIRLAALSVDGVYNVVMKPYTFGTGSFNMFVLTENASTPASVIDAVTLAINDVVAYGTKYSVSGPTIVPVDIKVKLMFRNSTGEVTKQLAISKAKEALKNYINSRTIGEPLIIDEITQRVMEVDDEILKYQISELRTEGKKVMIVDQECRWNERFLESSNLDAIIVT